jgi:hypothetical protein
VAGPSCSSVPRTRSGRGTTEEERRRGDDGAVRAGPGAAAHRQEQGWRLAAFQTRVGLCAWVFAFGLFWSLRRVGTRPPT